MANEIIAPEMFGAVGDGITCDTEAFKIMAQNNVNTIFLTPGKTYLIDSEVQITDKNIYGNGAKIVGSRNSDDTSVFMFRLQGSCTISDVEFESKSKWYILGLMHTNFSKITNCNFYNNDVIEGGGFIDVYSNNHNLIIENCKLDLTTTNTGGFWIRGGHTGSYKSNNILVSNCYIKGSTVDEVVAVWGWNGEISNVKIDNCYIEHSGDGVSCAHMITLSQSGKVRNLTFNDCEFIAYNVKGSIIKQADDTDKNLVSENIVMNNCKIYNYTNQELTNGIFNCSGHVTVRNTKVVTTSDSINYAISSIGSTIEFINCEFTFNYLGWAYRGVFKNCIFNLHQNNAETYTENPTFMRSGTLIECKINNARVGTLYNALVEDDKIEMRHCVIDTDTVISGTRAFIVSTDLTTPIIVESNIGISKGFNCGVQTRGYIINNYFVNEAIGNIGGMYSNNNVMSFTY